MVMGWWYTVNNEFKILDDLEECVFTMGQFSTLMKVTVVEVKVSSYPTVKFAIVILLKTTWNYAW